MQKSPYTAAAIANYFIQKNKSSPTDLTHLKIQKLLFFAQGWFMANYNMPLFNESFEAWRHGPVVRSIYHSLSGSGDSIISNEITQPYENDSNELTFGAPQVDPEDTTVTNFLGRFWQVYAPIHAYRLSELTHAEGTPWRNVYAKYEGCLPYGAEILDSDISAYFSNLKEKAAADARQ